MIRGWSWLAGGSGSGGNAFGIIQTPAGTSPTATSSTDTLNLTSSDSSVTITGNSGTKTVNFQVGLVSIANGGFGISGAQTTLTASGNIAAMPVATNNIYYNAGSVTTIQGITAQTSGFTLFFRAAGVGLTLKNQDASATAANRLSIGSDLTVSPGSSVTLKYSGAESRWVFADFDYPVRINGTSVTRNFFSTISNGGLPISGSNNVVLGNEALSAGTASIGSSVVIGYQLGKNINGSSGNQILIGSQSAYVVTGSNNIVLGSSCAQTLSSGSTNIIAGTNLANSLTTGQQCIILGSSGGTSLVNPSNVILLGTGAGANVVSATSCVFIGAGTGFNSSASYTNTYVIGQAARATGSDQFIIGGTSSPVNVGINNDAPAYRLDVGGDINVTGVFRISGTSQLPWLRVGNSGTSPSSDFIGTTDTQDFVVKTNGNEVSRFTTTGLFGVQKTTPNSVVHAGYISGTVASPGVASASTIITASGGYTFGSGSKNYEAYSFKDVSGTPVYSSTGGSTTYVEPATSDYDPSGGSATEQPGSGYDTSVDPPPSYQIWAIYDGGAVYSGNTASASVGSWSGSNPFADVAVSWTGAPAGTGSYFVVRNGSDFQNISGTSFTDSNSGWSGGSSPPGVVLNNYNVYVDCGFVADASGYRFLNTSAGTYNDSGTNNTIDTAAWTAGSNVSPNTAFYTGLKTDGDRINIAQSFTPATSSDPGVIGDITWDSSFIYVCIAANTWKRTALLTF